MAESEPFHRRFVDGMTDYERACRSMLIIVRDQVMEAWKISHDSEVFLGLEHIARGITEFLDTDP